MNCETDGCEFRSKKTCQSCRYWIPSATSKYYRCARFQSQRLLCNLASCVGCPYLIPIGMAAGRENKSGIDWNNPESVKKYQEKMRLKNSIALANQTCAVTNCAESVRHRVMNTDLRMPIIDGEAGWLCRKHYHAYKVHE